MCVCACACVRVRVKAKLHVAHYLRLDPSAIQIVKLFVGLHVLQATIMHSCTDSTHALGLFMKLAFSITCLEAMGCWYCQQTPGYGFTMMVRADIQK